MTMTAVVVLLLLGRASMADPLADTLGGLKFYSQGDRTPADSALRPRAGCLAIDINNIGLMLGWAGLRGVRRHGVGGGELLATRAMQRVH